MSINVAYLIQNCFKPNKNVATETTKKKFNKNTELKL